MQRILIITAVVVLLLGGGGFLYWYFATGGAQIGVAQTPNASSTLPTSGDTPVTPVTGETPQTVETAQPQQISARLSQISKGPVVSGAVAFAASSTDPSQGVAVRFIERESGNVYQYLVRTGALSRISNKTIPGIQEAYWLPDGSRAYVRYLSGEDSATINTYALPATATGLPSDGGFFLAQNIVSLAVNATNILALASGGSGSSATVEKLDGSQPKQVFASPLSSLRASYLGKGQYLAFTKPSALLPGFAYSANTTGLFDRLAGPLNGLAALASPLGKWVLISYTSGGTLKLSLINVSTRVVTPLPVGTIADKCAWTADEAALYCGVPVSPSTGANYPDDWYQGALPFADKIWRIDVTGRFAELTLDFSKETDASLDAVSLAIDPKSTVLVFKNKTDGSLWSYAL